MCAATKYVPFAIILEHRVQAHRSFGRSRARMPIIKAMYECRVVRSGSRK